MTPLAAAAMESYTRAYPFVLRLHMLKELESSFQYMLGSSGHLPNLSSELKKLLANWELRLKLVPVSFKIREAVLNLRRTVLDLQLWLLEKKHPKTGEKSSNSSRLTPTSQIFAQLRRESMNHWLQCAKVARKARYFQTAYAAALHARGELPEYHLERAKILWHENVPNKALFELRHGIDFCQSIESHPSFSKSKVICPLAPPFSNLASSHPFFTTYYPPR